MKILLIPSNNSLSHLAKCAALEAELASRGHAVLTAVSNRHIGFVQRLGLTYAVLPDIQEADGGALPSLAWFRSPQRLAACVQAEIDLIKAFNPDRVVGIFRFTLKISTAALDIPYDALTCGCMMPDVTEILGYGGGESRAAAQALYLDNFFRFAGKRMGRIMEQWGLSPLWDLRDLLVGDRTYLWDFPQFMPLPERTGRYHVGPLIWEQWPDICAPPEDFPEAGRPLAIISVGTRQACRPVVVKTAVCLMACGYNVIVACGGHASLSSILPDAPALRCWRFAPLGQLLCQAQLLVCHGGQMTIFEALLHGVPVLVIPSHPEQAHNGFCLERIGCGGPLVPPVAFKGDIQAYADAYLHQNDDNVIENMMQLVSNGELTRRLHRAQKQLQNYDAPVMIADLLEGA